jgi:hypothetical protein
METSAGSCLLGLGEIPISSRYTLVTGGGVGEAKTVPVSQPIQAERIGHEEDLQHATVR